VTRRYNSASDPMTELLGKNGLIAREIAKDLISLELEDKVKTTGEYARLLGAGQGTIQKAFRTLQDTGAAVLRTRGHQGTYLVGKDLGLLWIISGLDTVVGVMPLPNSNEFEGIATALAEIFTREDLPLNLAHLNGSRRRIEQLKSGRADFVVLSRFSADRVCAQDRSLRIVSTCPPGSYYARDSLTVLANPRVETREDIRRAGIDATSWDHAEITHLEFNSESTEFVQVPYHLIPRFVLNGHIDAAVWNRTTQRTEALDSTLRSLPLESEAGKAISGDMGRCSFVTLGSNHAIEAIFDLIVDSEELVRIQKEVSGGRKIPLY
jgi:YhfZ C-terminal domain/Helix-turn-helix domain